MSLVEGSNKNYTGQAAARRMEKRRCGFARAIPANSRLKLFPRGTTPNKSAALAYTALYPGRMIVGCMRSVQFEIIKIIRFSALKVIFFSVSILASARLPTPPPTPVRPLFSH